MANNKNTLDNFFGFDEAMAKLDKMLDDLHPMLSSCCSAKAYGELFRGFGRCSDCMEMAGFTEYEDA